MPRQGEEERLFIELEIAGLRHQAALFCLRQVIDLSEQGGADPADFQTAVRNLRHAGEVYDMALLQLTEYLRGS